MKTKYSVMKNFKTFFRNLNRAKHLLFVLSVSISLLTVTRSYSQWIAAYPYTTPNLVWNTKFVNASTGYAAGNNGTIIKTTDSGLSWLPLASGTTEDLYFIFIQNENSVFISGSSGKLIKSTNGGQSWENIATGTTSYLSVVYFSDNTTGYIAGESGLIKRSTDGGKRME